MEFSLEAGPSWLYIYIYRRIIPATETKSTVKPPSRLHTSNRNRSIVSMIKTMAYKYDCESIRDSESWPSSISL